MSRTIPDVPKSGSVQAELASGAVLRRWAGGSADSITIPRGMWGEGVVGAKLKDIYKQQFGEPKTRDWEGGKITVPLGGRFDDLPADVKAALLVADTPAASPPKTPAPPAASVTRRQPGPGEVQRTIPGDAKPGQRWTNDLGEEFEVVGVNGTRNLSQRDIEDNDLPHYYRAGRHTDAILRRVPAGETAASKRQAARTEHLKTAPAVEVVDAVPKVYVGDDTYLDADQVRGVDGVYMVMSRSGSGEATYYRRRPDGKFDRLPPFSGGAL